MSFILDALKKAERDRLRDEKFEIEDFTSPVWELNNITPITSKKLIFQISLVLIICCLGVLILVSVTLKDGLLDDEIVDTTAASLPDEFAPETTLRAVVHTENSSKIMLPSVPNILITGSIFLSDGSKSNRVFIDDRALRVGDLVDSNWMIESIAVDAVVLRFDDHTTRIAYPGL